PWEAARAANRASWEGARTSLELSKRRPPEPCAPLHAGARRLSTVEDMPHGAEPHLAKALTLDLDDTLWPVWPTIERAERRVPAFLAEHAPRAAAKYDPVGLRKLRFEVERMRPDLAHDLSGLRRESLRYALVDAGEDGALAEVAFEIFLEERNRVELFADVL